MLAEQEPAEAHGERGRISVVDSVKQFEGGVLAVDHVSFEAKPGEFVSVVGANGVDVRNITPEDVANIDGNPLAVLPPRLEEKRDAIVGFLRAWAMGQHLGQTHPEVVEAIVREKVPTEWRNEASGEAAFELSLQLMTPDDPERIGDLRLGVWETGQGLLFRAGILEEKADVSKALNDELIEEINDFDRAAVEDAAEKWAQENN